MIRGFRPKRCIRLRLALLAVLALLFQQMAFAAYACSPADMPASNVSMSTHCDGMPMVRGQAPEKAAPALCTQHCAQQTPTTQDVRLPNVLPLLLPALLPAQPTLVALPVSQVAHAWAVARRTPGIPPALRYRVLLI
jgi:hypothetical protein